MPLKCLLNILNTPLGGIVPRNSSKPRPRHIQNGSHRDSAPGSSIPACEGRLDATATDFFLKGALEGGSSRKGGDRGPVQRSKRRQQHGANSTHADGVKADVPERAEDMHGSVNDFGDGRALGLQHKSWAPRELRYEAEHRHGINVIGKDGPRGSQAALGHHVSAQGELVAGGDP